MELADFLESNPSIYVNQFQKHITQKKEFAELASSPSEVLPKIRGSIFKHQEFTQRLLRIIDNLLVISETGTGKTCEVWSFCRVPFERSKEAQTRQ